jgi:hypothetical protein
MTSRGPLHVLLVVFVLVLAACGGTDEQVDTADDPAADGATDEEYAGVEDQPDDAAASFVSPSDGDTVSSPFTVELDASNVDLVEAGIPAAGEGHLHVMADIGCYDTGETIPGPSEEDEAEGRFHLGDGSDSRDIDLEPGDYELCVQLGDGTHIAFGETETINVTVE